MTRLFPPEADCVARIHAQLERLATGTPFSKFVVRLTQRGVSTLVETAFWAGLRSNEGRTAHVRLAVASPEHVPGAIRFASPIAYEASEIARLAPAVPPGRCLGVVQVDDGFQIWGFAHRLATSALKTVVVETTEPGTVRVDVGPFRPFAVLDGRLNEIIEAIGSDLAHFLQRKLEKVFPPADILETQAIWRECLALADLVRMILDEGHGGAVLIVPTDTDDSMKSLRPFPYRFEVADTSVRDIIRTELSDTDAQGKLFLDLLQAPLPDELKNRINSNFPRSTWGGARAAMQAIAPLAGVDGAVVMTRDLKLLGFGAKIEFKPGLDVPVNKFQAKPGRQPVVPSRLEDLGGMRHQSAARFIAANKGAVAIVVSQDRHVSVMNWEGTLSSVNVVRNAEWWV
jgi:hypothetical protein